MNRTTREKNVVWLLCGAFAFSVNMQSFTATSVWMCVNWSTPSCSLLLVIKITENYQILISKQLWCSYGRVVKAFFFFFLSTVCWLRTITNNAQRLFWSHTYFLFIEEAAVPPCPLIPNLCQRPGGLWKLGIFQTPPLSHFSCNGHTR